MSAEMGVGGMATERLEAEITSFAADLTAALCGWLLLVGEYDRRGAYEQWECVSMAQWLGVHVAISAVTARQHVIVARRLGVLPAVTEAFGQGRVSYSRVRALCRVATPQDEASWLDLAVHTPPQHSWTGSCLTPSVTSTLETLTRAPVKSRRGGCRGVLMMTDSVTSPRCCHPIPVRFLGGC